MSSKLRFVRDLQRDLIHTVYLVVNEQQRLRFNCERVGLVVDSATWLLYFKSFEAVSETAGHKAPEELKNC